MSRISAIFCFTLLIAGLTQSVKAQEDCSECASVRCDVHNLDHYGIDSVEVCMVSCDFVCEYCGSLDPWAPRRDWCYFCKDGKDVCDQFCQVCFECMDKGCAVQ